MRIALSLSKLKYVFLALLAGAVAAVLYLIFLIASIDFKSLIDLKSGLHVDESINKTSIKIESDSAVLALVLNNYLLFSKNNDPAAILGSQTDDGTKKLSFEGADVYLGGEIELGGLYETDCAAINCLQKRVHFKDIPPVVWKGLIGIEDYRFLKHGGIDLRSILRAIIVDIKSMKLVQGGSTLTQQLVKNLFLTNEKSFQRKLKEVIYAYYIEKKYEKDQIINAYLNEVFWGTIQGLNVKGIYAASVAYFFKKPNELDEYETSILIALLKGPNYYHPIRNTDRLQSRANIVFDKLKELKLRSVGQGTLKWDATHWSKWVEELKKREETRVLYSIWEAGKYTKNKGVFNDYELAHLIFVKNKNLKQLKKKTETPLAVKIIAGDPHCQNENCRQFHYYSKIERNLKSAIEEEKHQIGSILKPIIYSLFINHGKKLSDTVDIKNYKIRLKSGLWSPRDPGRTKFEEVTLSDSLLKSLNKPVIAVSEEVGFDILEEELGFYFKGLKKPLADYPAQLIGAVELSLAQIYQGYAQFIKEQCLKIDDPDNIIMALSNPRTTTIKNMVGDILGQTSFFGKTGTTNNGLDNWFVSYTAGQLMIIWLGHEGPRDGKKLKLSGSGSSFKIFKDFTLRRGKRLPEFSCPL